ncbi:SHSP domain-containing protein [Trichostrongylus colubriformis]|uniref:SHSP domain-containing protein n=1 Tax=Trichostrongylus colubriformis TaxID=6319 RepID=A0AAN8FTN9_TRICO
MPLNQKQLRLLLTSYSQTDRLWSLLHVANDTEKAVDDDKKFAVSVDVSQFRPEELNVHLDGRVLTVEGKQEHKTKNSSLHRSFTRKWMLPENVDLDAVRTQDDSRAILPQQNQGTDAPKQRVHLEVPP